MSNEVGYELWDVESGNAIDWYDSLDEARRMRGALIEVNPGIDDELAIICYPESGEPYRVED